MKTNFKTTDYIYFIGIGGISMSGLAEILVSRGYRVAGTDITPSPVTKHLEECGILINFGHHAENITDDITHVIFTAAIKEDNPEYMAAKAKNIPMLERAELLGQIMAEYQNSIAIAGTHGKTTTTSMTSEILLKSHKDPTITVGGILPSIGSNLKIGNSPYFIAEACEYHDSFLHFDPLVGVILNVESDHLDYFNDLDDIYQSFHAFAKRISPDGLLVINHAIADLEKITANLSCTVETFGIETDATWTAKNIKHLEDGTNHFDLYYQGDFVTEIHLSVPGEHNIQNALAAISATHFLGVSTEEYATAITAFHGTNRRFQWKGTKNGVTVIDDYAHHPTEIKALLAAARTVKHNTTWCVFQPHTYSRTISLFDEFGESFTEADEVIIADIYAAREVDQGEISAKQLAERVAQTGKSARYVGNFAQIQDFLSNHCQEGDVLLTVGAGDVFKIGEAFLAE